MRYVALLGIALLSFACEKKEEKKKVDTQTELRSTGVGTLAVSAEAALKKMLLTPMLASSAVTLEYLKVPVSRINLSGGKIPGAGYAYSSPYLYECTGTTDADCLVDLTETDALQNLLQGGSASTFEYNPDDEAKSYDGVSVEFCHEFSSQALGTDSGYFHYYIKGTVVHGDKTYYTNATTGLSENGPAEEVKIQSSQGGCGTTSYLQEPITIGPDTGTLNVIIYSDPTGMVFATNNKTLANSACAGEDTLALCSEYPAVFGTVDDGEVVVERYQLVTGNDTEDFLMGLLFNSTGEPFGGFLQHHFNNTEEERVLHSSFSFSSFTVNADETITLHSVDQDDVKSNTLENFERTDGHTNSLLQLVDDAPLEFTANKL